MSAHIKTLTAALFVLAVDWKQSKYSSIRDYLDVFQYVHTVKCPQLKIKE